MEALYCKNLIMYTIQPVSRPFCVHATVSMSDIIANWADYARLPLKSATPFSLQSWRNFLYRRDRRLPEKPLHQLHQLDQILNPPYGSPSRQLHHRIFRHKVGPTGRNRDQMFTFL